MIQRGSESPKLAQHSKSSADALSTRAAPEHLARDQAGPFDTRI
jgi:hypothetical protein